MNLPQGFRYAATYAGMRKVAKDDLALIVSDTPAGGCRVHAESRGGRAGGSGAANLRASRGGVRAW